MDPLTFAALQGAAGAGKESTYVDDVFSTHLYEGTNSTHSITNGIDLSGKGGLTWLKIRTSTNDNHLLYDTERGATKQLITNSQGTETGETRFSSFNSNGFTITTNDNEINNSSYDYTSWSFRKAPGFFDVVKYTGDGSANQSIAHSLGSTPGMIIVKNLDANSDWYVWHSSLSFSYQDYLKLNSDAAKNSVASGSFDSTIWAGNDPTSTVFTVGSSLTNTNSQNYIAYIFANNDASFGENEDQSIIKHGTFTSGAFTTIVNINLGWEPQFFLVKKTGASGDWWMIDTMRGFCSEAGTGPQNKVLRAQSNSTEGNEEYWKPTPTGISGFPSGNSENYIYMAIRRPFKPSTVGTEVLAMDTKTIKSENTPSYAANFPVDLMLRRNNIGTGDTFEFCTRLTNGLWYANSSNAEGNAGSSFLEAFAFNNGWGADTGTDSSDYGWMLKRTPGFFDIMTYTGTGSNQTLNHNLEATPEMVFVKKRSNTSLAQVYHTSQGTARCPAFKTDPFYSSSTRWGSTWSSTQWSVKTDSDVNASVETYVAYLFATLPGVSKVGSYSGTGASQDINCGFTSSARFILIKRADTETQGTAPDRTNWYFWDSLRGIVLNGNDPWLAWNETDAQVTNTDYIDPLSTGFTVKNTDGGLNAIGGTYIFLAIA